MKDIICDGFRVSNDNKYDINLSSIFSHLIRECGRLVEDYNSDILYDIRNVEDFATSPLDGEEEASKVFWIGLRESGVDHEEFVECRCDNDYYYRGMYRIEVCKNIHRSSVTLSKSSLWDFRREHNIVL